VLPPLVDERRFPRSLGTKNFSGSICAAPFPSLIMRESTVTSFPPPFLEKAQHLFSARRRSFLFLFRQCAGECHGVRAFSPDGRRREGGPFLLFLGPEGLPRDVTSFFLREIECVAALSFPNRYRVPLDNIRDDAVPFPPFLYHGQLPPFLCDDAEGPFFLMPRERRILLRTDGCDVTSSFCVKDPVSPPFFRLRRN